MTRKEQIFEYLKERNIPITSLEANSIMEGIMWADEHPKSGKVNQLLAENGNVCEYWDGGHPECLLPWGKPNGGCDGNPFICKKLYLKYLASNPQPAQHVIDEFERRIK